MCSALKLTEENRHLNRHLIEIICTQKKNKEEKKKKSCTLCAFTSKV